MNITSIFYFLWRSFILFTEKTKLLIIYFFIIQCIWILTFKVKIFSEKKKKGTLAHKKKKKYQSPQSLPWCYNLRRGHFLRQQSEELHSHIFKGVLGSLFTNFSPGYHYFTCSYSCLILVKMWVCLLTHKSTLNKEWIYVGKILFSFSLIYMSS